MDETAAGVIAVLLFAGFSVLVVSNRNTPGFWSAEVIRARSQLGLRRIGFGGSIARTMGCALFISRAPIWFGTWADS